MSEILFLLFQVIAVSLGFKKFKNFAKRMYYVVSIFAKQYFVGLF